MKVKELIKGLSKIKDKERDIHIIIGDEEKDYKRGEIFELMHTDNGCDRGQCVELFMFTDNMYNIDDGYHNRFTGHFTSSTTC